MKDAALSNVVIETKPVISYIENYWPKIIRSNREDIETLIGLPHPYIVPSDGEMFQEMYYWDSFFQALGLVDTPHEQLIVDSARNMAYLLKRFGLIPNASRYYFLSRSQPPFFTQMFWLSYRVLQKNNAAVAQTFLQEMVQLAVHEHDNVWLGVQQPHHRLMRYGLSRYFDINYLDMLASCESGWDHSTRADDRWLQHLPIDLNSILFQYECDIARAFGILGEPAKEATWLAKAATRKAAIDEHLWDAELGFYFDFDLSRDARTLKATLAGFYPLWSGLASQEQADRIVHLWLPRFEKEGGLVTSLDEHDGRQWAAPNGWAPLQWLVTEGLERYGFASHAARIRHNWIKNCTTVFNQTGAMWEKYNVINPGLMPEEGLYGSVRGFGWSNGVFVDFVRKLV